MKRYKKLLACGVVAVLGVSLLAGCGSSDDSSSDTAAADASSSEEETAAAEEATETAGGTRDTLVIGLSQDFNDISPFGTMSTMRNATQYNFYEFMAVRKDFGAALEDMELECAKEINQVDDLTYEIEMYDYIYDTEGNHLTAEDYAWDCIYMRDTGNYERLTSYMADATATGDYTVEIELTEGAPLGGIEYILHTVPLISQEAYEGSGDEMATKPIGTGPYYVDEMIPGSTLTLKKNEDYWQTDDSLRSAMSGQNVDEIVFKVVTEASQLSTALQTGDVDASTYLDPTVLDTFYVNGEAVDGYRVEEVKSNMFCDLLPNMSSESILSESEELREAIYYAIDADSILTVACSGYGFRMNAMANPIASDYNTDWDARDYYEYDPEKAQELLDESGIDPSSVNLTILLPQGYDNIAEVMYSNLTENLGIGVELVSVEDALYQTYKFDPTQWDLLIDQKGTSDFTTAAWSMLFDARSFEGNVTANFIADDELQARMEAAMTPATHGSDTVNALEDYLEENAYAYGLYVTSNYIVMRDDVMSDVDFFNGIYLMPGCCTYY